MLDTFRGFSNLRNELEQRFGGMLSGLVGRRTGDRDMDSEGWIPAIDVLYRDGNLVIRTELPGVKQDDVEITLSGRVLTISGERKTANEEQDDGYYVKECRYGSFSRSLVLPEDVDESRVSAQFRNGVLEVTVAGAAEVQEPKHIQIEG